MGDCVLKKLSRVHKFGGTSVGGPDRYRNVVKILIEADSKGAITGVVVSAMKGITDQLIQSVHQAVSQNPEYETLLNEILQRHVRCVQDLLSSDNAKKLEAVFVKDLNDIREILRGIWLAKSASEAIVELISGHGEIWSAQILNAALQESGRSSEWLDARKVLKVETLPRKVNPLWAESENLLKAWLNKNETDFTVITGFVASTVDGVATTLKRNGSDFSASIFGRLLDANEVIIWTDVDGVMSADPRLVPDAVVLPNMSYSEATELAYFGAKVIHPSTMGPAIEKGIPIWIKNSFRPNVMGTKISAEVHRNPPVKGFATIEDMCLINVEGTGMVGVPGVSQRLFGALREVDVSVVMISQASSEQSICFVVPELDCDRAIAALQATFAGELQRKEIESISVRKEVAVLAMVGDGMVSTPGMAGRLFTALGNAGANILAIAQGSSERNISAVVSGVDIQRAVQAAHSAFFLSAQTLSVGILGIGVVGKKFLEQLNTKMLSLRAQRGIDIRIRAISNSKKTLRSTTGLSLKNWEKDLEESPEVSNMDSLTEFIADHHYPHAVVVDMTASEETSKRYFNWLKQGVHVITANKKAGSGNWNDYQNILNQSRTSNYHFMYETTVGAGLPVLSTLRDLLQTGDELIEIEGVLSGTLSYLFNSYDGTKKFSDVLREAKDSGYTEPDPRDDLSGKDVARKLVILAREAGLHVDMNSVAIESLVPQHLSDVSREEFLRRLTDMDDEIFNRWEQANKNDQVLRYVGHFSKTKAPSVSLKALSKTHPFARLTGSDNIFLFRTARYNQQPMVVQGPGAGPDVTAAGVFSELLRLASFLGAPQ